ncbi:MAG: hypothetical protein WBA05_08960 [Gordonia sp. (in: high G+C Gram-positive bacteria)]|uniref:hypothetical protein n=1 Tax=Gordonia sp. (in: high G+C Gram-positive bacteria) TaxID=84139 RepID=UPI003C742B0A
MSMIHMTLVLTANLAMLAAGYVYGIRLLRRHHNFLLGFEWIVIAVSGTNVLLLAATGVSHDSLSYHVMVFLDAFTRSFGMTLIFVLGMMVVTHKYRVGWVAEVAAIGAGVVVGLNRTLDIRPVSLSWTAFYTVMNIGVAVFMLYVALRLLRIGETRHGVWVTISTLLGALIAVSYDFVRIPGDDADHTLFYSIAMAVWALMLVTYYHGYRVLEAAQRESSPSAPKNGAVNAAR